MFKNSVSQNFVVWKQLHLKNFFRYLFSCIGSQLWHSAFFFVCFSKWNFFFFSCSMWDLVLWPGIKLGPPALGARSLSHWTTREVPKVPIISLLFLWGLESRLCFPVCLGKNVFIASKYQWENGPLT